MRRIIGGVAYDTEKSELVATDSHGEDAPSSAWWSLYKARSGAWFEVAADHDGVIDSVTALSPEEAQAWLERNANHLVEQHFGVMPELEPNRTGQGITEITRRNILDAMALGKVNWSGRLAEDDFLGRIFDLDHLPSNDHRFKTMRRDIWQHRVNNPNDWEDDWAFSNSRLNLLHGSDEIFLRFLCETVHPVVRAEEDDGAQLVALFNRYLAADGFQLAVVDILSGRSLYAAIRTLGVDASAFAQARKVADALSSGQISAQITRMQNSIVKDPALAIGSAKEFVESICKGILDERGIPRTGHEDFQPLVTMTRDTLALRVDPRSDRTLKGLLTALGTISNSIAELRGYLGTGHGTAPNAYSPPVEVARLAVGVATSLGVFLWDRHRADANITRASGP